MIKAVAQPNTPTKAKLDDSDDSEDDVTDPAVDLMPKHFDKEEAFFSNLNQVSRSNSAASLESENLSTFSDLRPSSACTDISDTSMNASLDTTPTPGPSTATTTTAGAAEVDESNFDAATLTCKLCNKVLKNMRTFRNHRARHLGTLNHKCPDCSKCFEGRSAVNRHMISSHGRELQHHEITNNPAAATTVNIIKPSPVPEIKLFKPSEMAKKSSPPKPSVTSNVEDETLPPLLSPVKTVSSSSPAPGSGEPNQMPILLENPESEVRYIVGSQLRPEAEGATASFSNSFDEDIKDPDEADFDQPLSASSPRKNPDDEDEEEDAELPEPLADAEDAPEDESDKSMNTSSKLPEKLKNFERIIPESDDSDSDKSDSDSSSSSSSSSDDSDDSDSDSERSSSKSKKKKDKSPEEITLDDEDEGKGRSKKNPSNKYHNSFESFLNKSKDSGHSDLEDDLPESKRKTRQNNKSKAVKSPKKSSKVMAQELPYESEDEDMPEPKKPKKVQRRPARRKEFSSSSEEEDDEDSYTSSSEEEILPKKSRGKVATEDCSPEKDKIPDITPETTPAPTKVSMVAAIFRAKKKIQSEATNKAENTPKKPVKKALSPKAAKKGQSSDSETDKEKNDGLSSDVPLDKETQAEADKLLEQKGVAVVGGKLMIPADRLKIPDELCLVKSAGRGRGAKKIFICQICEKQFNRADKMKYHLFNEHYDDFIRCSDSVPKILAKNFEATVQKTEKPAEKEKTSISKPSALARIFAKKNKTKNPTVTSKDNEKERTNISDDDSPPPVLEKETYNVPEKVSVDSGSGSKSPRRGRPPSKKTVEKIIPEEASTTANPRRSSRSPRGYKIEDDLESSKEKALIAPPSIRLPNIALSSSMLSPKKSVFGKEAFSSASESTELKSPFSSSSVTASMPGDTMMTGSTF